MCHSDRRHVVGSDSENRSFQGDSFPTSGSSQTGRLMVGGTHSGFTG